MKSARDNYQAYHTYSETLVNYLVDRIDANPGDHVLEPAAGTGLLIDATLARYPDITVDGYEVQRDLSNQLSTRYSNDRRIRLFTEDFIDATLRSYDRVIANPPYGAWLDHARRDKLQREYTGLYVRETYTLFMYRALHSLKPGGRAVFIVPETFLYLHRHKYLRHALLTESRIIDLVVFPSRLFPGIGMGYAKLCIITFERDLDEDKCRTNQFNARFGISSINELTKASTGSTLSISQYSVLTSIGSAFLLSDFRTATDLINTAPTRIGDIAACVTGFYSGNDLSFLRNADPTARNAKRYARVDPRKIADHIPNADEALNGIANVRHFVPVRKGGPDRFVSLPRWYMDWSEDALVKYRTNKKARLQNMRYYFRHGIAVPMVSGGVLRACQISGELFDQAIVGVFPYNPEDELLLLGFLNSPTATHLIKTINPTANNSANYLKKVPLLIPPVKLRRQVEINTATIIDEMYAGREPSSQYKVEIDDIFRDIYGF
ncbi:Eco57I restriction-modification methylase domain-containing protein [Gordonia sp. (in: high G+C Gram-positive bacteria)]|mgnify:FL=1|nr:N-6 DNA methylase [Gordonia sp. (in: high G+C Gram-positive bacteria)]HMS77486.1 N-6 DNA methylase [Gordonia sp. (in: high G+C Gram-positive bacteria)]HQV05103.1 N-6 DNA methylase [Novosphingobium sp.]